MDLSTSYAGLELAHPFVQGASPLTWHLDNVRRLEDAGCAAIVMHSLFEEQVAEAVAGGIRGLAREIPAGAGQFPLHGDFPRGPAEYLEHVRRMKEAVRIPVIGSLNGVGADGWVQYGPLIEEAGADALELNLYYLSAGVDDSSADIERHLVGIVRGFTSSMRIPVIVKLSPFYTSMASVASRLAEAGASGLVLFNRFYQTDVDVDEIATVPNLRLSTSAELLLRLRWLAILAGRVPAALGVSGGVHTPLDAVKAMLCGADGVQMVSAILQQGPDHFQVMSKGLAAWMARHGFETVAEFRGRLSLKQYSNPSEFERTNYLRILQTWNG